MKVESRQAGGGHAVNVVDFDPLSQTRACSGATVPLRQPHPFLGA